MAAPLKPDSEATIGELKPGAERETRGAEEPRERDVNAGELIRSKAATFSPELDRKDPWGPICARRDERPPRVSPTNPLLSLSINKECVGRDQDYPNRSEATLSEGVFALPKADYLDLFPEHRQDQLPLKGGLIDLDRGHIALDRLTEEHQREIELPMQLHLLELKRDRLFGVLVGFPPKREADPQGKVRRLEVRVAFRVKAVARGQNQISRDEGPSAKRAPRTPIVEPADRPLLTCRERDGLWHRAPVSDLGAPMTDQRRWCRKERSTS